MNYIDCGQDILTLLPVFKQLVTDKASKNIAAIDDDLRGIEETASQVCSDCGLVKAYNDGYSKIRDEEADPSECLADVEVIANYASQIIADPSNILQDLKNLEEIYKILPQALQDCEAALPAAEGYEEEYLF